MQATDREHARGGRNQGELLNQAADTYFQAIKGGIQLGQDVARSWTHFFWDSADPNTWGKLQSVMSQATLQAAENAREAVHFMEEGTRRGSEWIAQAFEAGRAATPMDAQCKLQQLWETSIRMLNANTDAILRTNVKVMKEWADFLQHNAPVAMSGTGATAASPGTPKHS